MGAHSREVLEDLKQALNQTQIERHIENIHTDEIYTSEGQGPLTHSIGRILESHCYAAYPHSIPRLSDSFSGYIVCIYRCTEISLSNAQISALLDNLVLRNIHICERDPCIRGRLRNRIGAVEAHL